MCHSQDIFGRHREAPAKTDMALVAPVQCKWTVMVALCPVVRNPVQFAVEGDKGKSQVVSFKVCGGVVVDCHGHAIHGSYLESSLFTSLFACG